jgi:hypothetical protein
LQHIPLTPGVRTSEALEAINEAIPIAERFEYRASHGVLHRLRGVFLAAIGGAESQIEGSFCEAIRIAKEQKCDFATETRRSYLAQNTGRQITSGSGGRGFQLLLS